jgi:hypothetical protein
MVAPTSSTVTVRSTNWVSALRFANQALRAELDVLIVTELPAGEAGERILELGSIVLPDVSMDDGRLRSLAAGSEVELVPLSPADRFVGRPLASIVLGLYGGGGAPFNQASILAECGFHIRFISDSEIRAGLLREVDALIVPGGGFRAMQGQLEPLGEAGCRAIARFVEQGGMYIGSCAGSFDCAIVPDDFVHACPVQKYLQIINARVWNDETIDFGGLQSPGVGVVRVKNERPDHPVMFGLPATFELVHYNGPIFEPLSTPEIEGASLASGLASFCGWTDRFTPAEAFAGQAVADSDTLLHRAVESGQYSVVAGNYGLGRVVAFGSHPEFGADLPMAEWALPARMLANAITWQSFSSNRPAATQRLAFQPTGPVSFPEGMSLAYAAMAAKDVMKSVEQVRARPIEPRPDWLAPEYALAFFGLTPSEIWRQSLDDIDALCRAIIEGSEQLGHRIQRLRQSVQAENAAALEQLVQQIDHWILDERAPEWRQDGGYQGIVALLHTATAMCEQAIERWDVALGPPAGPYAYFTENPYHLVAGSYLAAIGCVAGAWHLLRAIQSEVDMTERLSFRADVLAIG